MRQKALDLIGILHCGDNLARTNNFRVLSFRRRAGPVLSDNWNARAPTREGGFLDCEPRVSTLGRPNSLALHMCQSG